MHRHTLGMTVAGRKEPHRSAWAQSRWTGLVLEAFDVRLERQFTARGKSTVHRRSPLEYRRRICLVLKQQFARACRERRIRDLER